MRRSLVGALGKGLYEVVTSCAGNEYRVLFCVVSSTMLLLHGFQKKTRKTPKADLDLARARQKDVMQ